MMDVHKQQTMDISDIQAKMKGANSLTDEQVGTRCIALNSSITQSVFNYIRRGLFDKEKLMVATQLVLKILLQKGEVNENEVDQFLMARLHPDPHSRGTTLSEWMSAETWAQCRALEELKPTSNPDAFKNFGDELQTDFDWREWYVVKIQKLKFSSCMHYTSCNYRQNYFYWFIFLLMCSL